MSYDKDAQNLSKSSRTPVPPCFMKETIAKVHQFDYFKYLRTKLNGLNVEADFPSSDTVVQGSTVHTNGDTWTPKCMNDVTVSPDKSSQKPYIDGKMGVNGAKKQVCHKGSTDSTIARVIKFRDIDREQKENTLFEDATSTWEFMYWNLT